MGMFRFAADSALDTSRRARLRRGENMKARPRSTRFRLLIALVATVLSSLVGVVATSAPARAATDQFRGMNWAVLGHNFSTGPLVIQGLSRSDSNATVRAKANAVYDDIAVLGEGGVAVVYADDFHVSCTVG
jgi:hypothetical protein